MNLENFKKLPILGVLRGIDLDLVNPLVESIVTSGLETIEVTMNTKNASEIIRQMAKISNQRLTIGAGTVLTIDDVKAAVDAGATFIVSPTLIPKVVDYCVKNRIPVFPGAFTPQEIYNAWSAGATMVKVFPVKFFGPSYLKEIKGPFNDIQLLACGGVNKENMSSFFQCGASAIAFGASVFKKEWLKENNFVEIENSIKELILKFANL